MDNSKFTWMLYVIIGVIIGTITLQVYWNYKNYLVNKQQLINDVQLTLDDAVETYFTQIAQNKTIDFTLGSSFIDSISSFNSDSLRHTFKFTKHLVQSDSINPIVNERLARIELGDNDTLIEEYKTLKSDSTKILSKTLFKNVLADSTFLSNVQSLSSKVIVSMTTDSLRVSEIDSIFKIKIDEKNLNIKPQLRFTQFFEAQNSMESSVVNPQLLNVTSTSPFLHFDGQLTAYFDNPTKTILKRIFSSILLSTLLVLAVIACLFYLLNIIKRQKQIADIKNDLISNITHEFKTPISTIGVALESLTDFKALDDKSKTEAYIKMSKNQLSKLNEMVEKLLETASLDSESLELNVEHVAISDLIKNLLSKYQLASDKQLALNIDLPEGYSVNVDPFHFENAISNILDNAIKYGGNDIHVELYEAKTNFVLSISDNGQTLTEAHKDKIFDKFYRVQKGNQHDSKGFGIGLYYAKRIVEKHDGTLKLELNDHLTTFKITLPNA